MNIYGEKLDLVLDEHFKQPERRILQKALDEGFEYAVIEEKESGRYDRMDGCIYEYRLVGVLAERLNLNEYNLYVIRLSSIKGI